MSVDHLNLHINMNCARYFSGRSFAQKMQESEVETLFLKLGKAVETRCRMGPEKLKGIKNTYMHIHTELLNYCLTSNHRNYRNIQ